MIRRDGSSIRRLFLLAALWTALTIASFSPSGAREDNPDGKATPPLSEIREGRLDSNGASLFYKTLGSGDPIVVLHGGPGFDHRQFLPYIWELASSHQVIMYDQRATGLSSAPVTEESINIDTFIKDLEHVRQVFDIDRVNLLGHSWGGVLALHYSIRHPKKVRSLILCSTSASKEAFSKMRKVYQAHRPAEDTKLLIELQATEGYKNQEPEAIEEFWRVFFRPYFVDPAFADGLDLKFTENTIKNSNTVAGYVMQSVGEFDLYDDLDAIKSPTLVIHGDSDPLPLEYAKRIRDGIEGARLVVLPRSGHWPFVDATAKFSRSILGFLAAISDL